MKKSPYSKQQALDKTIQLQPQTLEELSKRIPPDIPKIFREFRPDVRRDDIGLCSASTWDPDRVSKWAAFNDLPEVARVTRTHSVAGGKLLRTDALTLQRLGVSSGREALLAEEYICQLARSVDHDASDNTGFPVEMHKSMYRGEAACPGYSPLDLLISDPWMDSRLRFLDTSDHCTLQWMGLNKQQICSRTVES
ncbi:hypothetical protein RRG08_003795 [Elysia crispata]|uniref:SAM domain-containing protein n=1 Tax=Elysia crispata TaxID=231223 RepID=A0AAE1AXH4_9GAST|nr:hypothetical protein RRG08_003795 [Elysia crispata]